MKFKKYNPVEEKGNCIIRSFSKLFNKDYYKVKEELLELQKQLNYTDYREIEVFETYLKNNNATTIDIKNKIVKDLELKEGKYAIFCFKDDFYHMTALIDNIIYDKNDNCFDLNLIKIYKI